MKIEILPLGAGQEVGRSCIIINFNRERFVMLDCGFHMGYQDKRRYPDFNFLKSTYDKKDLSFIDLVVISHFHLDHCGAIPILTEDFQYKGPIICSDPTRAIIPFMLEDYAKISTENSFEFSKEKVALSCAKITSFTNKQTKVYNQIEVTFYYAGHVLGAVMALIEYKGFSVLYTGDFNSSPDRHLRSCEIPVLKPNIVICESTYATVEREWKKERELQFIQVVKKTFDRSGKVLIPVFALGRAQELFALIEDIWKNTGWTYPVYYSGGLTDKVKFYYKFFVDWTNDNIKNKLLNDQKSIFDLDHINKFERSYSKLKQPMLVLATPGMLHGGLSLEIFKEWCEDSNNSILIPGYCVEGTVGNLVLSGAKSIFLDGREFNINMEVSKMSFSAHADNSGIINFLDHIRADNVVFVHGEKEKMIKLGEFLKFQKNFKVFCPKNFKILEIYAEKPNEYLQELDNDEIILNICDQNEHIMKLLSKNELYFIKKSKDN